MSKIGKYLGVTFVVSWLLWGCVAIPVLFHLSEVKQPLFIGSVTYVSNSIFMAATGKIFPSIILTFEVHGIGRGTSSKGYGAEDIS